MSEQINKYKIDVSQMKYNSQIAGDYGKNTEAQKKEDINKEKEDRFKQRLSEFSKINSLSEASDLVDKIMPVNLERTVFFIGSAKCTIIKKHNLVRISFNSKNEFISYKFV